MDDEVVNARVSLVFRLVAIHECVMSLLARALGAKVMCTKWMPRRKKLALFSRPCAGDFLGLSSQRIGASAKPGACSS